MVQEHLIFWTETFEQAVPDYGKAIENQRIIGETSIDERRALASLFFKQAMAYEYSNKSTPAIETLTKARGLLEFCVKELQSQDSKEPLGDYDPLTDLQSLIPEISEKVQSHSKCTDSFLCCRSRSCATADNGTEEPIHRHHLARLASRGITRWSMTCPA